MIVLRRRQHGIFVRVAALAEPEAEEFLIDHVGFEAGGEARGVAVGEPITAGVGCVDFVDEDDFAVSGQDSNSYLVSTRTAARGGDLLAEGEKGLRLR